MTEPLSWPSGDVWGALLLTGILATALCFAVQTYAQQRVPAVRAAVIFSMKLCSPRCSATGWPATG